MMSLFHPASTHTGDAPACDALLARYQPGDQLFASPSGTLLGQGVACAIAPDAPRQTTRAAAARALNAQVQALLHEAEHTHGIQRPVAMGAVPFDVRRPARLSVPRQLHIGQAPQAGDALAAPLHVKAERATPSPDPAVYEAAVVDALARFQRGELDKVVLARALDLQLDHAPDRRALLGRLAQKNLNGYTFAIALPDGEGHGREPAAFIGATPELLVRRVGTRVVVNPLAGSAARRALPDEDQLAGQRLLASAKDRREHAVVIDAVVQALKPLCRTLHMPEGPSLLATDALWHLSTTLTGELADPATTALDLALALHPTPAVCGQPVDRAFSVIEALEPVDRGLFAGFVGWCDAQGDGEWAVSLRCAELRGRSLRLHAGAGIVPGSDPRSESQETGTKFRTMLSALGMVSSVD
ncbi:isochorismate synthase [Hydrogenophaga sp.]|uniref:isochorismate synthase n=1 Tax=Hydrogenophaga sp. TaxID=1904254 RepID=UPI0027160AB1|nr:isochorismate synthase [Hydrogenophaga sp.]MDO9436925.1 isochorismate synthase [Hydrogenophaga sp.]